jgi:PAS domain S-box-containing protein
MIQPAFDLPDRRVNFLSLILGAILVIGAIAALAWAYRRNTSLEATIRRQMARESSLKARFDDIFERSHEILIVHDRRGRVTTINRAGEQATGYSREEIRVLDPSWIFGTDYLDAVTQLLQEGAGSAARSFRSELVARKGSRVPVDVHIRVLVGDGEVVGATAIARDLTARAARKRAVAEDGSGQPPRHGIAHDFNNPDHGAARLQRRLIDRAGDRIGRGRREIRRAAERASGLTQRFVVPAPPMPCRRRSAW